MTADDRTRLQRILASFDEAGLVALANKGLVRRAQKDLEAGGVSAEETDAAVLVRGPGWVVTMPPEGPTHATDTTRATGVTRQILAATIYLRDHWSDAAAAPAPPPASAEEETGAEVGSLQQALLDLTLADLQKWAGKTVVKEVLPLLSPAPAVEIETHAGLTIRLVRHEVEARLLPGRGNESPAQLLDRALTMAARAEQKRWVVLAVLAFQLSRGRPLPSREEAAPAETAGAPIPRHEVLAATRDLLDGMVATGLAHPSERVRQRLSTMAVSATAVHLPRLARLLRALADDVALVLGRHAAADTGRLLDRLGTAYALAKALAATPSPPRGLVGYHRTEYDPVGDLLLAGVGAYPWQTASGYEGLTVLFWDLNAGRFRTWTVSRPAAHPGRFSLEQAYRHEVVWPGGGPPERLGRSRFTLRRARANALGRLSGSQQTSVSDADPTVPGEIDFGPRGFSDWDALLAHARTTYPLGLAERDPLDRVVVLRPKAWGDRWFDELQQRFAWRLEDAAARSVQLTLPWTGVNESAVQFLEAVKPDRDRLTAVVCRIAFGPRGLLLEPLTLLSDGTPQGHHVLNPAFDQALITSRHSGLLERLRKKFGRDRLPTAMTTDDEGDGEGDDPGLPEALPPQLRARLSEVEGLLLRTAEAGLGRRDDLTRTRFRQLAARLNEVGFGELARAVGELEGTAADGAVAWAAYLCRLHRQALALQGGATAAEESAR